VSPAHAPQGAAKQCVAGRVDTRAVDRAVPSPRGVLERMGAIGGNRLTPDERKAIRRAIHRVIPWVMEDEKKELEVLDAKKDYEFIKGTHEFWERQISNASTPRRTIVPQSLK
jgi:hypothetical protein